MSTRYLVSRASNQLRCWFSYALSLVGVVRVQHMPTFVSIEPANFCQLRCPECPVGQRASQSDTPDSIQTKRPRQLLSPDAFRTILAQIQSTAHTVQFYFQGEPLLNPALPDMIALARRVGMYTIVSTNAQALTEDMAERLVASGLNRIIVSIDGFTPESYAAYRVGGHLPLALAGLRYLRAAKQRHRSHIRIELQVLRLSTNESEWAWIRRHYRTLGASCLTFKTAQLYDYEHGHPLMPSSPRYSRYRLGADGLYHLHRPRRRSCYRLWSGCVITANGTVLPCCYDKSSSHPFGNCLTTPLQTLWHSATADMFRATLLEKKDAFGMCRECYY